MPRLSIDLFSSLPGILLSFGHFVHRKRATSEHLAESHEQPVQCMIRGDLKNMEYNWPPIHHMYRPFLLVVHFISSCIFGSSKKSLYHLHFGLLTKISIIVGSLYVRSFLLRTESQLHWQAMILRSAPMSLCDSCPIHRTGWLQQNGNMEGKKVLHHQWC